VPGIVKEEAVKPHRYYPGYCFGISYCVKKHGSCLGGNLLKYLDVVMSTKEVILGVHVPVKRNHFARHYFSVIDHNDVNKYGQNF
jgi:hypothetical protein